MGYAIIQCFFFAAFIIAIDLWFTVANQRYTKPQLLAEESGEYGQSGRRRSGFSSFFPLPSLNEIKDVVKNHVNFRWRVLAYFELTILAGWALILGAEYMDLNLRVVPAGSEFSSSIQSHYFWLNLKECGVCALWNGSLRGGYPALADIQGSFLHPLVIITTLGFGIVNGVKITVIATFWIAGVAQWWIAHELKLSWLPRIWSALIAMAGGHLTGKMELGIFGVLLSLAMASLVFAAILHLENTRTHRAAILLGGIGAMTIVAGQGYIQAGLIVILPAALIFIIGENKNLVRHWSSYVLAGGLGIMLAAPFLLPLIHFSPNIGKEVDTDFGAAQPLRYLVLNLVIDDVPFHFTEILGKLPYPYLYSLYIGWTPILLAIFGMARIKQKDWRIFGFLILGAALAFLAASGVILRPLAQVLPFVGGVRHSSQIAALAVPLILGLAAYGLDNLLKVPWPKLFISNSDHTEASATLSLQWLFLLPILFLNVKGTYDFAKTWLYTETRDPEFYNIVNALYTGSTQWVEPPFGEHAFIEPAIAKGFKLSPGIQTWLWIDHEMPEPKIYITREGTPPGDVVLIEEVHGLLVYENRNGEYAAINANDQIIPCKANAQAGLISMSCETDNPGILTVKENYWAGWRAWVDNMEVPLEQSQWLQVKVLPGRHTYTFRYLPWDVLIGVILFVFGIIICILLWLQPIPDMSNELLVVQRESDRPPKTEPDDHPEKHTRKRKKPVGRSE